MDAEPLDPVVTDPVAELEFERAFALLRTLVYFEEVERLHPSRGNAVYTTSVVLWMLIYQRLSPEHVAGSGRETAARKPARSGADQQTGDGRNAVHRVRPTVMRGRECPTQHRGGWPSV